MSDFFTTPEFATALVAEFTSAIGAVADGPVAASGAPVTAGDGWVVLLTASGLRGGTFSAWMDQQGAAAVAKLVMGGEEEPDDQTITDMLREMWTQAASAVCLTPQYSGLKLVVSPALAAPVEASSSGSALDLAGRAVALVVVSGDFEMPVIGAPAASTAPAVSRASRESDSPNLDVVLDIELPLVVRFGRTVMSLKALSGLGPGSILDMGRSPDEPVELLVSDRVIARGEVVIVSGNYGVRITDLVSAADRARVVEV